MDIIVLSALGKEIYVKLLNGQVVEWSSGGIVKWWNS